MRIIGPIFVLLATGLITAIIVVHFRAILPYFTPYFSFGGFIHTIWSCFLSFNILFNYFMVVFTPPGTTEKFDYDEEAVEDLIRETSPRKGQGFSRFCKKCKIPKPPRSHHCHVCNKCVLRMDHHCPWISNCVGWGNHKYFFLFLMYLWTGCVWIAMLSFSCFRSTANFRTPYSGFSNRGTVIFIFVLTLSVSIAVGFLFFWHFYLVLSGQTTIEFYFNKYQASEAYKKGKVL